MKKLKLVAVAAIMMMAVGASAQTKIGYIRIDDIVGLMPELGPTKINMDTVGQKFVEDSVLPRFRYLETEIDRKSKELADTGKPAAVRAEILKSLQRDQQEYSTFDQLVQQVQQYEQQRLLRPYYAKAKKAIDAVAKKKGYTHVFNSDVFLIAPDGDDLSLSVLAELGIKPPNQAQPNRPTGTTPGGAKPAGN